MANSLYDLLPKGSANRLFEASKGCGNRDVEFVLAVAAEIGTIVADLAARVEALEHHATNPEKKHE